MSSAQQHHDFQDALAPDEQRGLAHLVAEWQIVADLVFGDLVLWTPQAENSEDRENSKSPELRAYAQARPFTTQTTLLRDVTGSAPRAALKPLLLSALRSGKPNTVAQVPDATHALGVAVWPVRSVATQRVIAVISVHHKPGSLYQESVLEQAYRATAHHLLTMISVGLWPDPNCHRPTSGQHNPRVGDGMIRLSATGHVVFASPNGMTAFRKLGVRQALEGKHLAELALHELDARRIVPENLTSVLSGKTYDRAELITKSVALTIRSVPLLDSVGERIGALVLVRDVTEVWRRDEQLIGKDATIREIHHRVKNNLQTVGSLLRMQARRMSSAEARHELLLAMGRVDTIALVHETLAQTIDDQVDLDDLLHRQFRLAVEIAAGTAPVKPVMTGSFGQLPSDLATPLALVVNELATNAVEHGTDLRAGGTVILRADRKMGTGTGDLDLPGLLTVEIHDEGVPGGSGYQGSDPGQSGEENLAKTAQTGLGTEIVRTLVRYDLRGSISWETSRNASGLMGTVARVKVPIEEY